VSQSRGDVALRDVGSGHGEVGGLECGDPRGLLQPEWLYGSMTKEFKLW